MKSGRLSYFKRDSGLHMITFIIEFDEKLYQDCKDKIKRIVDGKDLIRDNSDCKFCQFNTTCKQDKEAEEDEIVDPLESDETMNEVLNSIK